MRIIKNIFYFYYDGFRNMTIGRTLWLIIAIKLFIIFAILRVFFFQPTLHGTDKDKSHQVYKNLLKQR